MTHAMSIKLARIRSGERPRVLDLFSGCGGLSLGFDLAGCSNVGGIDMDEKASLSHAINFHPDHPRFAFHASPKDILKLDPLETVEELSGTSGASSVDIIVGGPPCPAFARVGRAKLREVEKDAHAFLHDPRAQLFRPYLAFVEGLQPIAVLMENVPDILNFGGTNVAEVICGHLDDLGYRCSYTLLNAASYGVPQMRERFFLVAVHRSVGELPAFPAPGHHVVFPPGYGHSRDVALKTLQANGDLFTRSHYVPSPTVKACAPPPVSAADAISDLPPVTNHLNGELKRGARRFDEEVAYGNGPPSVYARKMRSWPGFESRGFLKDHVTRSLSARDYRLFECMEAGDEYPAAHALAVSLFAQAALDAGYRSGTKQYEELKADFIPPYAKGKFPNKWRKLEPDAPARTLMAHLGKDTYSHIHYDSAQARVITVREAARLQSFPDGFTFAGTMNPAFRQIGNSVPPLLSSELARSLMTVLGATAPARNAAVTRPKNDLEFQVPAP